MWDDLFESIDFGLSKSEKAKTFFRISFGLLGFLLGLAGIWKMLFDGGDTGLPLRLAFASLMFFMACFFGVNVALHKRVLWPAKGFVISFIGMFVVRFVFGA